MRFLRSILLQESRNRRVRVFTDTLYIWLFSSFSWYKPEEYTVWYKKKLFFQQELASMVDQILDEDDLNKDGYIDYPEFIASQQREEAVAK